MGAIAHVSAGHVAVRAKMDLEEVHRVFAVITAFLEEGVPVRIAAFGSFVPLLVEQREVRSKVVPNGIVTSPGRRKIQFRIARGLRRQWTFPLVGEVETAEKPGV